MKIATLGPEGTCSEAAAIAYVNRKKIIDSSNIILCKSFENSIQQLLGDLVHAAIIPGAYIDYHKLVFANLGVIKVHEVICEKTPAFVLAAMNNGLSNHTEKIFSVSCHMSPSPLLESLSFKYKHINANSNVAAAQMVKTGISDFCITTMRAIDTIQQQTPQNEPFKIMKYYGSVDMIWAIFTKIDYND